MQDGKPLFGLSEVMSNQEMAKLLSNTFLKGWLLAHTGAKVVLFYRMAK